MHSIAKKLPRLSLVILVFFMNGWTISAFCQEKITEKSGKQPEWINSTEEDFIIESGKGTSLEQARDKALMNVKESIVKSIAEKITATSEERTEESRQGNAFTISGNYQSAVYTKTADLPFIKGVSLNKVSEFYWEKRKDKQTGNYIFYYYLKYPFSALSLQNIILDYELAQRKINDELELALEGIDEINSVEEVLNKMQTIRGIVAQLDENGKAIASMNLVKLDGLLKSLSIEEATNQKGEITYFLSYGSRHFTTSLQPKISSNCADHFHHFQQGNTFILKYDPSDCFEVVSNILSVEYRVGNYTVKHTFPLILN